MHSERRDAAGRYFTPFAAIVCAFALLVGGSRAAADQVTPSDRVVNHVSVRAEASSSSETVGKPRPGEKAELLAIVGAWYRVKFPSEDIGFVSRAWTIRLATPGAVLAFKVHFLDVGTRDSAVIDLGDKDIVIDGGMFRNDLHSYVQGKGIIDGPIELLIVTHADSDHWKGLNYLLGFDEGNPNPAQVLEFCERGYGRDCNQLASYDGFYQ